MNLLKKILGISLTIINGFYCVYILFFFKLSNLNDWQLVSFVIIFAFQLFWTKTPNFKSTSIVNISTIINNTAFIINVLITVLILVFLLALFLDFIFGYNSFDLKF
jgi:hypothetical protein